MTPDPYMASGGPADPQSWNRYSYVQGDPVNFTDKSGLNADACVPDDDSSYCRYLKGPSGYYGMMLTEIWTGEGYTYSAVTVWVPTGDSQKGTGAGGGLAVSNSVMSGEWFDGLIRAIKALKAILIVLHYLDLREKTGIRRRALNRFCRGFPPHTYLDRLPLRTGRSPVLQQQALEQHQYR
jgi:hypothetical protein